MASGYPDISKNSPVALRAERAKSLATAPQNRGGANAPIKATRKPYPGINGVINIATDMVGRFTGDERIRSIALNITKGIRSNPNTGLPDMRNVDGVAKAIYKWMTRNINYVRDPWDVERVQTPVVTVKQKAGDCDDHAILGASLLQSLGIQTGFRMVSRTGRTYDHIYAVYKTPSGWKSFDTTIAKHPGYKFDERLIKKSKHIKNSMPEGLGVDPVTIAMATASAAQTGMTLAPMFNKWFGRSSKDKNERMARGQWREYLINQGVRSDVISFSQKDNSILQRYAMIIQELGQPAINRLNTYGDLDSSFVAAQRKKNSKRKLALYSGITAGALALTGAGYWAYNNI